MNFLNNPSNRIQPLNEKLLTTLIDKPYKKNHHQKIQIK